jgi:hypothetical protein
MVHNQHGQFVECRFAPEAGSGEFGIAAAWPIWRNAAVVANPPP